MEQPDALSIAYSIADESKDLVKLLVIGYRADGSTFTTETGLTVDEAKEMAHAFVAWMDRCIGREIEKASHDD